MKIIVGLDGSDHALVGLEVVACLSLTGDDELILASVARTEPVPARRLRREHERHLALLLEQSWTARRAEAQRHVETGRAQLGDWQAPVTQVVRSGHPVAALAALADELAADLLVVGPRGRGPLGALPLGSVTHSLLGVAPCPVLVARRPARPPRRVVLAVDGSLCATAATRVLTTFPLADDAVVEVISVVAPWTSPYRDLEPESTAALLEAETRLAREIATREAGALSRAGRRVSAGIRTGHPEHEIVEAARSSAADLIVVGCRGRGGISERLLGSVSGRVAATAPCSVLVVGEPSRRQAPRQRA